MTAIFPQAFYRWHLEEKTTSSSEGWDATYFVSYEMINKEYTSIITAVNKNMAEKLGRNPSLFWPHDEFVSKSNTIAHAYKYKTEVHS